jgi:pimeloyl-ACP methyl ester carboxylesterase
VSIRVKRAFLDTEDGQILYRIAGEGQALVLLHMNPRSSDEFRELMPIFAQNYRVIAMDLMGFGDSDKPPRIYSIADYAETVIALLDELEIEKANILGNHTGAYITSEVAAKYPQRVEKIILSNIDKFSEQQVEALLNKYLEIFQIKSDNSELIKRLSVRSSYAESTELNYRCFLDELKCHGYPPYGPLAVKDFCPNIQERLKLINCTTLILSGTENIKALIKMGLSQPENRTSITEIIPQAKFLEIEGGTFLMMNQKVKEISNLIIEFIDGTDN